MKKFRVMRSNKVYRRKLMMRRFMTISIILGIFVFAGYNMYNSRMRRINEAMLQLEYYESRLSDVMIRQGYYQNEIIRLGDDDYIAMLAREHLLSLPDEIIFIIEDPDIRPESGEEN